MMQKQRKKPYDKYRKRTLTKNGKFYIQIIGRDYLKLIVHTRNMIYVVSKGLNDKSSEFIENLINELLLASDESEIKEIMKKKIDD